MSHIVPPPTIIDEPTDEESGSTSTPPVKTPPPGQPTEWLDWSKVEKDPRYQKAAPNQQETIRQRYWDSYLTKDPRISPLSAERQQQIMEKFVRPPQPEGLVAKATKLLAKEVQQKRELDPGEEALNYFVTEAIGGSLAAGGGGLGAMFRGLVEGRTDVMPEVYKTTRDSLRKYLVAEPTTEAGKKLVGKLAPIAAWPFEKVDQIIDYTKKSLFDKLEPKVGLDQAFAISQGIGEGLRGTLIFYSAGLGGKFGGAGSVERQFGVPGGGQPQVGGPPVRPQLTGPDIWQMPGEVQTPPKLLEGPVEQGGGPSPTLEPIAPPEGRQGPSGGPIVEGEYRIITPEPVSQPSTVLGMSVEELRTALTTDELTGLPNRRAYNEAPKKPVQVLNDVDGLKYINDNFGHEAGDALLKTVAQIAREEGLDIYRAGQGADEFVTQFETKGEAYQALGRLQQRLSQAVIEAEKPDGTKVRLKGLAFSYGVGGDLTAADKALNSNKATREQTGLRAERGGRPPSLEEISVEAAKGNEVSSPTTKVETAPTPPLSGALEPTLQLPSSPVGAGGSLLAAEPLVEVPNATLRETKMDMIRKAAERYEAKKRGLTPPKEPPIVEVRPKSTESQPGPSPKLARPEKGLPIIELTKEEFEAELRRSKAAGPISAEEQGLAGTVRLYSGLPFDESLALIRAVSKKLRGHVGTRYRTGEDLSLLQVALKSIVTPSFLSKVDPIAADFVATNQALRHGVYYKTAVDYNAKIDKIVEDLTPQEEELVGRLLDTFHDISEIPLALLDARRDITPKVLDAFTAFRERVFEPLWSAVSATAPPKKLPGKVHEYFTRVYEDFLKGAGPRKDSYDAMIRTFAEENGLDYADAYRIFHKQVPSSGFFGPVSESRTAEAKEAGRVWNVEKVARLYVAGVSRKMYLDQMLPLANKALEEIQHPRIREVVRDYVDRQRGVPDSALRSALHANPIVAKIARFEALRQYTSKLGLRPVLTLINATQYPLLDGTKAISRALFEEQSWGPVHSFVKGAVDVFTEKGRALVDRSGVRLGPTGWTPDPRSLRSQMERIAQYTGWAHRMVDEYSRAASYLRNYYDAERILQRKGIKLLPEEEFLAKNLYAMKGVAETQFFYDVSGAPAMYSNPLLANLGRFKQYTINMAGFVANLPARELVIFMGMLDVMGGPDAIPGIRQMYAQLRRRHPDSLATKVLNGLQEWSIAGLTGLDIGAQVGFGFIPGASTEADVFRDYEKNFWGTVGRQLQGSSVGDIVNLFKDVETGTIDLSDPNWRDILGSRSASGISVTMQKGVRGLQEWDKRYTEWSRNRKGVELSKKDVIARAVGIDTTAIARRQQEYAEWNSEIDDAIKQKQDIEDRYVKFVKDSKWIEKFQLGEREATGKMMDITDQMEKFNQKYGTTLGVFVTAESVREAYINSFLEPEIRMGRSRLQQSLLKGRLDPYKPD